MKKINLNIEKILENLENCKLLSENPDNSNANENDESVPLYSLTQDSIYNYFLKLNHTKKSHENLTALSRTIADAYHVSPVLANQMWNNLWDENRMLKGLQRRYFILVIFSNLVNFLGADNSVKLLLMEEDRLKLILERDEYRTKAVLKTLCKYYITNSKYEDLINTLNLYQKINSINNITVVNNEELCFIIYSIINPRDNNYGQPSQEVILNNIEEINTNRTMEFCDYLNDYHNRSTLHCLIAAYLSCTENKSILDIDFIRECSCVLTTFSFNNTIDFLIKHERDLDEDEINSILRKVIATHDLFFRHGFDILEDRKSWFELKISNENVFLGFFEKRKCMLSDFEIDFLIQLMLKHRWNKLQECFELVSINGDVYRLGSLMTFISNSVQSYKRKYIYSTLDMGLFKVEMEYSAFCGIEYPEIATIDKPNMQKYKNVLSTLLLKIPTESREAQTLNDSIKELEERLQ